MESKIVKNLKPEYEPVAVVWSDTLPENTLQFKSGKYGCILNLFAEAARRGKIAGGSRDTIRCSGGRAALGFETDFSESDEKLDHFSALFSKGLRSARYQEAYRANINTVRETWQDMFEYGERRHCSAELAEEWILKGMPRYDIPNEYVLFKPFSSTDSEDNIRAVIFSVNPVELSCLVTFAGSVMHGTDSVQVPQGADCFSIGAFAYDQADKPEPKPVLGMLGADGREVMRKKFRDDTLTLTIPAPLFKHLEEEAEDSIFQIPSWQKIL